MTSRLALCVSIVVAVPAIALAQEASVGSILARTPSDSLPAVLRRIEATSRDPAEGAQAVMILGQLHFARGEFRDAAAAYARAAARLAPSDKPGARYAQGLSFLGL